LSIVYSCCSLKIEVMLSIALDDEYDVVGCSLLHYVINTTKYDRKMMKVSGLAFIWSGQLIKNATYYTVYYIILPYTIPLLYLRSGMIFHLNSTMMVNANGTCQCIRIYYISCVLMYTYMIFCMMDSSFKLQFRYSKAYTDACCMHLYSVCCMLYLYFLYVLIILCNAKKSTCRDSIVFHVLDVYSGSQGNYFDLNLSSDIRILVYEKVNF